MPSMVDYPAVPFLIIGVAMLLSFVEVIAYAAFSVRFLRRVAKPFVPPVAFAPVHLELLDGLPKHGDLVFKRRGNVLLVRRSMIGRRAGAWAYVEVGSDGTPKIGWAPYPRFAWVAIMFAFGTFGGLTFGGGSWIAAAAFAAVFALVSFFNLRASRGAFEQVVWPELARRLAYAAGQSA